MVSQYHDRSDTEQPRARQVGEALPAWSPQPPAAEQAPHPGYDLDEQIERVCWLMRRDPMRERGRAGQAI